MPRSLTCLLLTLVAAAAPACSSGPEERPDDVRWLVDHGRFDDAVRLSAQRAKDEPKNKHLQAEYRDATVAWLLEAGRRFTFEDQDDEALAKFVEAERLAPDSEVVRSWVRKTRLKLAEKHFRLAIELHANDQMPEALAAYELALKHDAEDTNARVGREISMLLLQYRNKLGERYFEQGLEAASKYWLEYARARFAYAAKYQGEDGRAPARGKEMQKLLAMQRLSTGRAFEEQGSFGAARGEYRMALMLDPDAADAKAGLERAQLELSVHSQLARARLEIVRGRLEKARELAQDAHDRTVVQKEFAQGVIDEVREARLGVVYDDALALERDGRFTESLAVFDRLLGESEYFRDSIARRDTLQEYVRRADELYARVQATQVPEDQLALLREIELFWPEYKDVRERIAKLEAAPSGS